MTIVYESLDIPVANISSFFNMGMFYLDSHDSKFSPGIPPRIGAFKQTTLQM